MYYYNRMCETVYCASCFKNYTSYYFNKHLLSKKHLKIRKIKNKIYFKIEKKKVLVKF